MDELQFRLEVFEGPLDLLLKLIAKNKIDICDIPITLIFDQYMEYLNEMKALDMEIAGEFITMAAELMLIKSRMLLPRNEPDAEDPRANLAAALLEYKRAKESAAALSALLAAYHGRVAKDPEVIEADVILADHHVEMLQQAMERMIRRNREFVQKISHHEHTLGSLLSENEEVVPIPQKIYGIMRRLSRAGDTPFEDILLGCRSRSELVAAFMAVLELLRSQRVVIAEESMPLEEECLTDDGVSENGRNLILHLNREKAANGTEHSHDTY